jgi:hypothetical protein
VHNLFFADHVLDGSLELYPHQYAFAFPDGFAVEAILLGRLFLVGASVEFVVSCEPHFVDSLGLGQLL